MDGEETPKEEPIETPKEEPKHEVHRDDELHAKVDALTDIVKTMAPTPKEEEGDNFSSAGDIVKDSTPEKKPWHKRGIFN